MEGFHSQNKLKEEGEELFYQFIQILLNIL